MPQEILLFKVFLYLRAQMGFIFKWISGGFFSQSRPNLENNQPWEKNLTIFK